MTKFRPCIDLHEGKVKQVVGGTFDKGDDAVETNFTSTLAADYYAHLYRKDNLEGGHVIQLGAGNETAAKQALQAWPQGLQIGGGICLENATSWLEAGASAVIVTSTLFDQQGHFLPEKLANLSAEVGKERLVIDLSCRRIPSTQESPEPRWQVTMARWTKATSLELNQAALASLAPFCAEFLIHAADVEGRQAGMDEDLLCALGKWSPIPITYAGGANQLADLALANKLSAGKVDLTIGSALDIFGGNGVGYQDCVRWNQQSSTSNIHQ